MTTLLTETDGPGTSIESAINKIDNLIQTHELDGKKPWVELKEEIRQITKPQSNGSIMCIKKIEISSQD